MASSADRAAGEAAADGGNGRRLAKALSVPHLTAIGMHSSSHPTTVPQEPCHLVSLSTSFFCGRFYIKLLATCR
jgi:hypothetical protein